VELRSLIFWPWKTSSNLSLFPLLLMEREKMKNKLTSMISLWGNKKSWINTQPPEYRNVGNSWKNVSCNGGFLPTMSNNTTQLIGKILISKLNFEYAWRLIYLIYTVILDEGLAQVKITNNLAAAHLVRSSNI